MSVPETPSTATVYKKVKFVWHDLKDTQAVDVLGTQSPSLKNMVERFHAASPVVPEFPEFKTSFLKYADDDPTKPKTFTDVIINVKIERYNSTAGFQIPDIMWDTKNIENDSGDVTFSTITTNKAFDKTDVIGIHITMTFYSNLPEKLAKQAKAMTINPSIGSKTKYTMTPFPPSQP